MFTHTYTHTDIERRAARVALEKMDWLGRKLRPCHIYLQHAFSQKRLCTSSDFSTIYLQYVSKYYCCMCLQGRHARDLVFFFTTLCGTAIAETSSLQYPFWGWVGTAGGVQENDLIPALL